MLQRRGVRCAALLVFHMLFMAGVRGTQPQSNPRGWQAARQSEQRATVPPPAAVLPPIPSRLAEPAAAAAVPQVASGPQKTCNLVQPLDCPTSLPPANSELAAGAAVVFLAGVLAGALLHIWLQHWRRQLQRRWEGRQHVKPPVPLNPGDDLSQGAAPAAAAAAAAAAPSSSNSKLQTRQQALSPAGLEAEAESLTARLTAGGRPQPTQMSIAGDGPAVEAAVEASAAVAVAAIEAAVVEAAAAEAAVAVAAAEAVTPVARAVGKPHNAEQVPELAASGSPAQAAAPATVAVPPQVLAAAAVQELIGQHSTASSSSGHSAGEGAGSSSSGSRGAPAQLPSPFVGNERQPARAEQQGVEPLPRATTAVVAVAASPSTSSTVHSGAGAAAATLGMLRAEDQADIQAAGQLVLTMCTSMQIDPEALSQGERLQLMNTMLQAWQAQQAQKHTAEMSRIGSEANALRSEHRDIAAAAIQRQAAKDAYRLSLERTASFRRMCSDMLTFGLVVMAATGTYQLLTHGLLASVTASCPNVTAALGSSRWGLWAAWRAGEAALCHVLSVGDALLGLGVLLAAPWVMYRSGLLSDFHSLPLTKLFVGLGVVCGLAGYLAVGKLGGSRPVWLAAWEAWVALHIAFSATAYRMQRVRLRAASGTAAVAADAAAMYEETSGWLEAVMWVLLGVALPVLAGTLPFRM